MTDPKIDVSEVKKLIAAVGDSATALDAILADGKLGFSDLVAIPGLIRTVKGFSDVDFGKLEDQISQLDETEKKDIVETFKTHLNLHNHAVEDVVEIGFGILVEAVDAIKGVKDVVARITGKLH